MRNVWGFVSKRYPQPDDYKLIFNDWVAIYRHSGIEYHVELVSDFRHRGTAKYVEILRQDHDCRRNVCEEKFLSIKGAVNWLMEYFKRLDL